MKTIDYISMIQEMNHVNGKPASFYRVAELLDVSQSTTTKYRRHGSTFDDKTAIKVAALLNIDPAVIFADMQAERAKSEETRSIWQNIADTIRNNGTKTRSAAILSLAPVTPSPINFYDSITYALTHTQEFLVFLILCKINPNQSSLTSNAHLSTRLSSRILKPS